MGGYVELHCHSYYSLLDGASSPEALVERAAALGYPALALTDHDGLYGAVRFWRAARRVGIKPIIGAEVSLVHPGPHPEEEASGAPRWRELAPETPAGAGPEEGHLTLLAENQRGYANLSRLISAGQLAGQKGEPSLSLETVAQWSEGLICLSGCRQGAVPKALLAGDRAGARRTTARLRDLFGPGRFWIEIQCHYLPTDRRLGTMLAELAGELGVGLVATNNVHYAEEAGQRLHDVLTCIRHLTTLPEALAGGLLHPNSEQFIKSAAQMAALFDGSAKCAAGLPLGPAHGGQLSVLRNSLRIAERCNVSLDFSAQRLPTFPVPEGHTLASYLRSLCEAGLGRKFDPITPQARAQLDHELAVVEGLGLAGYFLVVWDIVRYAREQGIRCQGRGSAANSLVAYLLSITPVDPLRHNLLFERFLSEGTHTMPDIDVDFAADRREEVIQYVYDRYGEEYVGMVCNVVTYRARSALRDTAKALAFPPDVIDRAAKALDTRSPAAAAEAIQEDLAALKPLSLETEDAGSPQPEPPWQLLSSLLQQIEGVPRHLSIHVGGMLITAAPLVEIVPLERATMPGRVVVQWDKDSVEDAGLIKIDLLGLRTLGVVEEAVAHIHNRPGMALDIDNLPLDDPAVFELLQRADTVGCFQVESRAQAQMLPRLRPDRFEDIVVGVALIRPGPIQGGMVHPYLRRRQALEPVEYIHPALEPALAETLGVIVFQEQVIRVAMAVAGFAPADADRLRRTLGRSRPGSELEVLRQRFLEGAQVRGLDRDEAEAIFQQVEGFAGFGFCKSHAAAFALVAYQTLYLKAHFPAEFFCGLLNHQPMGFYPPEVLIGDAGRHGVPVLHPDANRSREACTLEKEGHVLAIRLGLRYVHGLGEAGQQRIVERREGGAFRHLWDFCRRTCLPRPVVENLIRAGAMDSLGPEKGRSRRDLVWELGGLIYQEEGLDIQVPAAPVVLPPLARGERVAWEYELLGMAPGDHVIGLYREMLQAQGVLSTAELQSRVDGERVRVAGWPVVRQRPPTAKGHLFVTLEDETGLANLIVRPNVFERYRAALRNAPLLWIEGKVQREGYSISVLVERAAAIEPPAA
ncbi:MAG: DNA polymerase III subunit alpha [Anaerolineae bacterium]